MILHFLPLLAWTLLWPSLAFSFLLKFVSPNFKAYFYSALVIWAFGACLWLGLGVLSACN